MKHSRSFAHARESVPSARRFVAEVLVDAPPQARDAITLMVSELASNCVRHSKTSFDLTIMASEDEVRVEATDHGGGQPAVGKPKPTDLAGRGLLIVDMFSADWGVRQVPGDGKTVWFVFPLVATGGPRQGAAA
jgi:serine/threonine-protein kinase RsbW